MAKIRQAELSSLVGCEITTTVKYLDVNLTMKNIDLF